MIKLNTLELLENRRKTLKFPLTFGNFNAKIVQPHRMGLSWHVNVTPSERDYTI